MSSSAVFSPLRFLVPLLVRDAVLRLPWVKELSTTSPLNERAGRPRVGACSALLLSPLSEVSETEVGCLLQGRAEWYLTLQDPAGEADKENDKLWNLPRAYRLSQRELMRAWELLEPCGEENAGHLSADLVLQVALFGNLKYV